MKKNPARTTRPLSRTKGTFGTLLRTLRQAAPKTAAFSRLAPLHVTSLPTKSDFAWVSLTVRPRRFPSRWIE